MGNSDSNGEREEGKKKNRITTHPEPLPRVELRAFGRGLVCRERHEGTYNPLYHSPSEGSEPSFPSSRQILITLIIITPPCPSLGLYCIEIPALILSMDVTYQPYNACLLRRYYD